MTNITALAEARTTPTSAISVPDTHVSARELFGNLNPLAPAQAQPSWALAHPEIYTLIWSGVILLLFVPLATWQYGRSTTR